MKKHLLLLVVLFLIQSQSYAACQTGYTEVIVQIIPDSWPNEISWQLSESGGNILQSGTSEGDTLCVPVGSCLEFVINDSYGDGIYAPGGYWLYVDGIQVATGYNYGSQDMVALNCPPGMHCTSPLEITYGTHWATFEDTWFVYTADSSGTYNLTTCDSNSCNTQLWLYTSCPTLPYTDGPMGSYIYNDDNNCGTQASMNFTLVAGTTYLIRIGDNGGDCSDSINFSFSYFGPVMGCMDPSACNFNPLATVSDNSCIYYPNPMCQGPDLQFDSLSFINSISLQTFSASTCDVAEGCVTGYGTRYVLSFTSKINNIGTQDYYIGTPSSQPGMFNTNNCHGHAHYEGYGDYRLYDSLGTIVPAGHKNGYCVMDLCGMGQYNCGDMGISAGCYDVYGAGTQCQWIDITDVADGDYRLAILINSQHLPDALGHYETNHLNNALQICIRITHNAQGVPSYSILPNCTPYVDCNGVPGGVSETDCNGICGGPSVYGDLNSDALLNTADITSYMDQVESQFSATTCNDLNGDGELTIFDVAQSNWCYYGNPNIQGGTHNHCQFPRNLISFTDTSELSIVAFDPINNYIDVGLKNPRVGIKGYQFTVSGIDVFSYISMINPLQFQADVRYIPATHEVIAFGLNDSTIPRSTLPRPLIRLFYNNVTDTVVCISSISDIMNERGEGTIPALANNCRSFSTTNVSSLYKNAALMVVPNPAKDEAYLHISEGFNPGATIMMVDITGKQFQVSVAQLRKDWVKLDLKELPNGVYMIRILDGDYAGTARVVKL